VLTFQVVIHPVCFHERFKIHAPAKETAFYLIIHCFFKFTVCIRNYKHSSARFGVLTVVLMKVQGCYTALSGKCLPLFWMSIVPEF
jgi:hypothetical protein